MVGNTHFDQTKGQIVLPCEYYPKPVFLDVSNHVYITIMFILHDYYYEHPHYHP